MYAKNPLWLVQDVLRTVMMGLTCVGVAVFIVAMMIGLKTGQFWGI